jgi:hypothetical protein
VSAAEPRVFGSYEARVEGSVVRDEDSARQHGRKLGGNRPERWSSPHIEVVESVHRGGGGGDGHGRIDQAAPAFFLEERAFAVEPEQHDANFDDAVPARIQAGRFDIEGRVAALVPVIGQRATFHRLGRRRQPIDALGKHPAGRGAPRGSVFG